MSRPRLLRETEQNIVNLLIELKSNGYAESTLKGISIRLRHLNSICDLNKPELVKRAIADKDCSNTFKQSIVNSYNHYVRFVGLSWVMPTYIREDYEIQVPSEENLNLLIGQATMITAMKLLLMKEGGLRPIEIFKVRMRDFDFDRKTLTVRTAKGGSGRTVKLKESTIRMVKNHVVMKGLSLNDRVFKGTPDTLRSLFSRLRRRVAEKLSKPELLKIRLYDLRHFYATKLYRKTKDIVYVQRQLGHRSIKNTLRYVHLVDVKDDEYISATATTLKKACELIEAGFEYVTEVDRVKIFRKPK